MDIAAHELLEDHKVKELDTARGNSLGGNSVNDKFEELLTNILGTTVTKKLQRQYPGVWLDMIQQFEHKKRSADPYNPMTSVVIKQPCLFQWEPTNP